jgi:phosphoglycerol transferase
MNAATRRLAPATFLANLSADPLARRTGEGWRALPGYATALVACLGVLAIVLPPWEGDFRAPYAYHGDALYLVAAIKGIVENGWYLVNPRLGAPFGQDIYDYPMADGLHWECLKLLTYFFTTPGVVFNLYLFASFPLTTLTTLAVLRRFGVSFASAIAASLLYTFLPWHFMRIEHLFLACYYMVPPMVMVVLEICLGRLQGSESRWRKVRAGGICLLVGAAGVYYAFFGCFFLVVASVARFLDRRDWRVLRLPAVLIGLITLSVFFGVLPSLVYRVQHGANPTIVRYPSEAERFGLRLTQLLLPTIHHRLAPLQECARGYKLGLGEWANENATVSLGMVGAAGFVGLVILVVFRRPRLLSRSRLLTALGVLCVTAFLLGTVSGGGMLFNFFFGGYIRGYNRIAIFIAFLSFFAVALVADRLRAAVQSTRMGRLAFVFGLTLVTVLGLLDQTNAHVRTEHAEEQADFQEDEQYVAAVEQRVPAESMIYQMPYVVFPESRPLKGFMDYDMLRPYIHSRTLRWSYGAMRGRSADAWHKNVAEQPIADQLETLARAGFVGISLDRAGYVRDTAIEEKLEAYLGPPVIVSSGERFVYYELPRER